MKYIIATTTGLMVMGSAIAQELNSSVIHNYKYAGVGYALEHDFGNSGVDFHGVVGEFSYDYQNARLDVSGGYAWADHDYGSALDVNLWAIDAGISYVVRLLDNRLNILPRFGVHYQEASVDFAGNDLTVDATSIWPGITFSYAVCSRMSVYAGYAYGYLVDSAIDGTNFDMGGHIHRFDVGAEAQVMDRVGLRVQARFDEGYGFSGLLATMRYHF